MNSVFVSKNQQLTFCKIIYNSIFILTNPSFLSTFTFATRFSPCLSKSCNLQVLRWHYRLEKVILAFNRSHHSFENIFQIIMLKHCPILRKVQVKTRGAGEVDKCSSSSKGKGDLGVFKGEGVGLSFVFICMLTKKYKKYR